MFTGCIRAHAEVVIRIKLAYQIGLLRTQTTHIDILVKFPDWPTKQAILAIFRGQQGLEIEGERILIYPDLSTITVWKRKNRRFLTAAMVQHKIQYR